MKRHDWFHCSSVFLFTLAVSVLSLLGLSQQAPADHSIPSDLEDQYARQRIEAETRANSGLFLEALKISEGIPTNSKHHTAIQEKQEMWAKLLLQQAREVSQRGEPQKAAALLRPLASRPNFASEVENLSAQWQRQANLLAQLEQAEAQEDWAGVLKSLETIRLGEADLVSTPRLQEISERATQKMLSTPVKVNTLNKSAVTPMRSIEELIGLGEATTSPINIQVGSTAIDLSAIEKSIRPNKSQAVTPRPTPLPVMASPAITKSPKVIPTVTSAPPANAIEPIQSDSLAQPEQPPVDPAEVAPIPSAVIIPAEEAIADRVLIPEAVYLRL